MTDVTPSTAVVLVAAGSGTRLGERMPKAFVRLGDRTILEHAVDRVLGMTDPVQLIVVVPAQELARARELVERRTGRVRELATVIAGGSSRQASVAAGLAALGPTVRTVLVHDAARALTPSEQLDAVARAAATASVVPGLPVTDTIKRIAEDVVLETVDRSELLAVQTPQGFPRDVLVDAYASAQEEYTDDAAVVAAAGHDVHGVPGDPLAFKITTPWDLQRAERLVAGPPASSLRTGIGVDVHAFSPDVPLWLGGLHWPDEPGLAGHSDGDAIAHAICDAVLSAAGLGDIGSRFGTADPGYAGARGEVFLRETVRLVTGAGYSIVSVAVQVVSQRPKLSKRRAEVEAVLEGIVGAPVSVAGTTTDGLGFPGRGEGLTAIASALVERLPGR